MIRFSIGQLNIGVLTTIMAFGAVAVFGLPLQLNTFLDRLLEKVPEADRAAVRADYSRAQDLVTETERTLDEAATRVRTTASQQTEWWNRNKDVVVERDQYKTKYGNLDNPHTQPATGGLTEDVVNQRLESMRDEVTGQGLGLMTTLTNIALNHLTEFGTPLDMGQLAKDAIAAKKPLDVFYAEKVAPDRATKSAAAAVKHEEEIRADERRKTTQDLMSKSGQVMPYPTGNSNPSTLSGLRPADAGRPDSSLQAAVDTATRVAAAAQ